MWKKGRIPFFVFPTVLILACFPLGTHSQSTLSQPSPQRDVSPAARLGALHLRVKTIEGSPAPLKILELEVEINNNDPIRTIPPGEVKVRVTPGEILPSSLKTEGKYDPSPEEAAVTLPIPPRGSRSLLFGFSLPPEKLDSISFEVQIHPPGGEKKATTYQTP